MKVHPHCATQRGISAIELAAALPVLLLIFWFLVTTTNLLFAHQALARATEDAARAASLLSGSSSLEQLAPYLAPCTAMEEASIQCELLMSLAHSSLVRGDGLANRFDQLQDALEIEISSSACGTGSSSLGIAARLPLDLIRILPPGWSAPDWMPTHLGACAVLALQETP